MDQNQTVDNDLQKAIDNITNNTNTDPVFSDPVAAPSSVPEGDTGELGEPVGPFPEPAAPLTPADIPGLEQFTPAPAPAPMPEQIPAPELAYTPEPAYIPEPMSVPEPTYAPEPIATPEPAPIPEPAVETASATTINSPANLNTRRIKEAALRDLVPLLDHTNMTPSQKFNICRNIFEDLRDYTVLEQAYRSASEIPNEAERAEALLYLVESIDKM